MRKRWNKRFAVVVLAAAVSVYTVPKTGLLAALGLNQTTEAEETSSDQKGPGGNGTPPEPPSGAASGGAIGGDQPGDAPGTPPSGVPDLGPGGQGQPGGGSGGQGQPGGGSGGAPGGTSFGVSDYSAVNKLTSDAVLDGQTITSTGTDENAVNVSEGANVTVKNSTVSRESSDSTGGDHHKPGYLRWHSCSRWRHTSRMECNRRNQRSVLCGNPERSWRRHNGSGGWNIYF